MRAVFNTPAEHNLVVCTLCSCYPIPVLGLPPIWYKSPPYRSRAVLDPRGVLADFGVALDPSTAVRVWDSTAELRYLVIPMRPAEILRSVHGRSGSPVPIIESRVTRSARAASSRPSVPSGCIGMTR